ncbi:hypothetical protein F0562_010431 [Nyssa sinensis]|uniref:Uncharacterized protein n=1 Tax=Nyssa sinensis TaxID=561372 RepID=A0A5J5A2C5_9ASTE|nr:hypothetical protein F0562_010431 [Nyssa sinensis]
MTTGSIAEASRRRSDTLGRHGDNDLAVGLDFEAEVSAAELVRRIENAATVPQIDSVIWNGLIANYVLRDVLAASELFRDDICSRVIGKGDLKAEIQEIMNTFEPNVLDVADFFYGLDIIDVQFVYKIGKSQRKPWQQMVVLEQGLRMPEAGHVLWVKLLVGFRDVEPLLLSEP